MTLPVFQLLTAGSVAAGPRETIQSRLGGTWTARVAVRSGPRHGGAGAGPLPAAGAVATGDRAGSILPLAPHAVNWDRGEKERKKGRQGL